MNKTKLVILGANGFTGSNLLNQIDRNKFFVTAVYHKRKDHINNNMVDVLICGSLNKPVELANKIRDHDIFISCASCGFGQIPNLVEELDKTSIRQYIFISTTGIFTNLNPKSKDIRIGAEKAILNSKKKVVIIRPTMIYGSSRDRNISRMITFIKKYRCFLLFGDGLKLIQPIFVTDLSEAILRCVNNPNTFNKCYNIAGKTPITFKKCIEIIAEKLAMKILVLKVPLKASYRFLGLVESLGINLGIKSEQILRLNEDKSFSYEQANIDFGFSPLTFSEGLEKHDSTYK